MLILLAYGWVGEGGGGGGNWAKHAYVILLDWSGWVLDGRWVNN